jgi:hypothetical protein
MCNVAHDRPHQRLSTASCMSSASGNANSCSRKCLSYTGVTPEMKQQAYFISQRGNYRVLIPDLYKGKSGINAEEAKHVRVVALHACTATHLGCPPCLQHTPSTCLDGNGIALAYPCMRVCTLLKCLSCMHGLDSIWAWMTDMSCSSADSEDIGCVSVSLHQTWTLGRP